MPLRGPRGPILCGAVLCALSSGAADAQWSGELSLGYLATSGNTSTASVNGKLALDYQASTWSNSFEALGAYSTDQGEASAERYAASDKVDWEIDERDYIFAAVDWEKDLFGGIRERMSETVGYGRHVLVGPVHTLDLEIGAGARQTEANVTGERENNVIGRGLAEYEWKLTQTSHFAQTLKVESGAANTFAESVSELRLAILGDLHATLSYTVRHNSQVPANTRRTDTFTAVSLSYAFGRE